MINPIKIKTPKGDRLIGPGHPTFIVAEMSGNHNQSIDRAYEIIDAAIDSGADAIKLQTYTPDTITIDSDKEYFQVKVNDAWRGQTLYELYKKAYTPWDWQEKLKKYAEDRGVLLFSTPFDNTAVDFLEKLDVSIYKIASFEVVDIPLIKKIGQTKKPVIMSIGMSNEEEIELAIKTLKDNGCPQIAILYCVSDYPAKIEEMNLSTITDISKRFNVISGLSDHSLDSLGGIIVPVIGVTLGANIIEKHFTIKRSDGGPDSAFSLEPKEFKQLVNSIRETEILIGKIMYGSKEGEKANIVFRKSLFVVKDIKKGEKFTKDNIRSIRPGNGMEPKYYDEIIGKTASCDIERGEPLNWTMINKI